MKKKQHPTPAADRAKAEKKPVSNAAKLERMKKWIRRLHEQRAVGLGVAVEAIRSLGEIPKDDHERKPAGELVNKWVKKNLLS